MRILFDHGTPAPLASFLKQHTVHRASALGWNEFTNGDLLEAAEAAGYDLLLTTDKNIRYQQNLTGRRIAIVVLGISAWPVLRLHVNKVIAVLEMATPGSYNQVEIPRR